MIATLTGFMGSGKSSVGRKLSALTQAAFIDLDDYIVEKYGRSIPELFSEEGEKGFRRRESKALKAVLEAASSDSKELSLILSLGGGTIVREENAALLREKSTVIFLRAKLETLEMRLEGGKDKRPLLQSHSIAPLLAERTPLYESNSDIIIDTDALNTTEVAQLVIESLKYYDKE